MLVLTGVLGSEGVTRVPAVLVLPETEVVAYLFHSSLVIELLTLYCSQAYLALKRHPSVLLSAYTRDIIISAWWA